MQLFTVSIDTFDIGCSCSFPGAFNDERWGFLHDTISMDSTHVALFFVVHHEYGGKMCDHLIISFDCYILNIYSILQRLILSSRLLIMILLSFSGIQKLLSLSFMSFKSITKKEIYRCNPKDLYKCIIIIKS